MKIKSILWLQSLVIIVLLLYILFYCGNINSSSELDDQAVIAKIENSKHTINENDVRSLYENYQYRFIPRLVEIQEDATDRKGVSVQRKGYLPTEYSLVTLDNLKSYIAFLDVLQKKNKEPKISGIAISFGAYDLGKDVEGDKSEGSKFEDPLRKGDYRGRLTTYFTPTYYDNNIAAEVDAQRHIPFYIAYDDESDKYKGEYKSLFCYLNPDSCFTGKEKRYDASILPSINFNSALNDNVEIVSFNEFTDMPPKKPKKPGNQ